MSDFQRYVTSETNATHRASWERSFPAGSVQGDSWINAVMEDLQNYAEYHKMNDVSAVLAKARASLRDLLN